MFVAHTLVNRRNPKMESWIKPRRGRHRVESHASPGHVFYSATCTGLITNSSILTYCIGLDIFSCILCLSCKMAAATLAPTDLRAELKEWERAFSAANGGRKAGRHDIKNNPDIGMLTGYTHSERASLLTMTSRQIQSLRPHESPRNRNRQR